MDYVSVTEDQAKCRTERMRLIDVYAKARKDYKLAELFAESEENKAYLNIKAQDTKKLTDTNIRKQASQISYQAQYDAIAKESAYLRAKEELELIKDDWSKLITDSSMAKEEFKKSGYGG